MRAREPRLLSVNADSKTRKGLKYGHLTGVLYLAPAKSAGLGFSICASASEACESGCLHFAGRSRFDRKIQQARIRRTKELFADRRAFVARLERNIEALIRKADREHLIPCVRLNGTSDLPWLALWLAAKFPRVQFYDYTKHDRAWERVRPNYHLTFSWSGENQEACERALARGLNVAVPFDLKKSEALPATWMGRQVVDGDLSDLRFLDECGVIVGLRVKTISKDRKAVAKQGNFVVSILPAGKAA